MLDSDGSVNGVSRKCEESPMGSDLLKLQPVTMNIIVDKLAYRFCLSFFVGLDRFNFYILLFLFLAFMLTSFIDQVG